MQAPYALTKHTRTIENIYSRAPYRNDLNPLLELMKTYRSSDLLADLNIKIIKLVARMLDIHTELYRASDLEGDFGSTVGPRAIPQFLAYLGGTCYITGDGQGSRRYVDELEFGRQNIKVETLNGLEQNINFENNLNINLQSSIIHSIAFLGIDQVNKIIHSV